MPESAQQSTTEDGRSRPSIAVGEADARLRRRNLWQGPFQMLGHYCPSKREQVARQTLVAASRMPSGFRIKGNISHQGKKIYHVPGQRNYERASIDRATASACSVA